jgi:tripartite-type tricarboxylate transporter receptor subunit TctC
MKAILTVATLMALAPLAAQAADPVADFYTGKQIRLIVGFPAGGGYDAYSRVLARHMSKHIPGNPTMIVQNQEGAASRVAANNLFNVAPKDGTTLGTLDQATPSDQALGESGVQFDTAKFNWLGNPIVDNNVTSLWSTLGVNTIDEMRAKGAAIICGGSGATSSSVTYPQALNNLAGTKAKIIAGYPGSPQMDLAMERGEINCRGGNQWSSTVSARADWLRDKKIVIVMQWGPEKNPEISQTMGRDVPLISDFAKTDEDKRAMQFVTASVAIGRPLVAPPGVPAERIAALRRAFDDTMTDPEYLADATKSKLIVKPISGEKLQAYVVGVATSSGAIIARAKELIRPNDVQELKK